MKGKHKRSVNSRANAEAQQLINDLQHELELLSGVADVSDAHKAALATIDRLTAKVVELEGVRAERDRLANLLESSESARREAQKSMDAIKSVHEKFVAWLVTLAPEGEGPLSWLISQVDGVEVKVAPDRLVALERKLGKQIPNHVIDVIAGVKF